MYKCKRCGKQFPVIGYIYGYYFGPTTNGGYEEVHPPTSALNKDTTNWAKDRMNLSHFVRKPCCPFCLNIEIEEVADKVADKEH